MKDNSSHASPAGNFASTFRYLEIDIKKYIHTYTYICTGTHAHVHTGSC